jgi:hypothetical protein
MSMYSYSSVASCTIFLALWQYCECQLIVPSHASQSDRTDHTATQVRTAELALNHRRYEVSGRQCEKPIPLIVLPPAHLSADNRPHTAPTRGAAGMLRRADCPLIQHSEQIAKQHAALLRVVDSRARTSLLPARPIPLLAILCATALHHIAIP